MFTQFTNGGSKTADLNVSNAQLEQWHHFMQTYDATTGVITGYLDGVATHTLTDDVGGVRFPLQTYAGFRLGTYRAADGRWFKGLIDEVAMWQRALAPGEAAMVYSLGNASVPLSSSGAGLAVTAFGKAAGGGYEIAWSTTAGLKYSLEASSDLIDWSTELVAEVAATGASMNFIISPNFPPPPGGLYDPGLDGAEKRFYRVALKP
jgi:hypothetical protein